ncbi:hypothetical protein Sjap_021376 [Stephania japonica]|uniref:Uncharacterized protein n=1 Tax=Stephania japonica TaxID=461633 RepID=A0AAP0HRG6_9MAGN
MVSKLGSIITHAKNISSTETAQTQNTHEDEQNFSEWIKGWLVQHTEFKFLKML